MNEKELFIGIWQVPPATEENYKQLADCGMTAVFLNGDYSEGIEAQTKAVAFCEKYGLDVVLEGRNKIEDCPILNHPLVDSEAVIAFNIFDEPLHEHEQPLRELAGKVKSLYPHKQIYINLNPSYAPNDAIMNAYPKYVDIFAKYIYDFEGAGGWLSIDYYPLHRTRDYEFFLHEGWFGDMETTAVTAKKYGLKPHFFIQSMAYGGDQNFWNDRTPTEADLRLQIYSYLAHGAKGFTHFCYQTPTTSEFYERQTGLFDKGAPTERWYFAQKIHGEIKAFESDLLGLSWEYCRRVDSTVTEPEGLFNQSNGCAFENFTTIEKVETNARCLVGAFKGEDGKEGFMFVNVEDTSKDKSVAVKLTFKKPTTVKIYKDGKPSVKTFDRISEFTLGVGEGIFMIEETL